MSNFEEFLCVYCKEVPVFDREEDLIRHHLQEHTRKITQEDMCVYGPRPYDSVCLICHSNVRTDLMEDLSEHLEHCGMTVRFVCKHCEDEPVFPTQGKLARHHFDEHTSELGDEDEQFVCDVCQTKHTHPDELDEHLDHCGSLAEQYVKFKADSDEFTCQACGETYGVDEGETYGELYEYIIHHATVC